VIGGEANLANSTISGNSATGGNGGDGGGGGGGRGGGGSGGAGVGGGLGAPGTALDLTNVTVAGNRASGGPGGDGEPDGAPGPGMAGGLSPSEVSTLANTVLARNRAEEGPDCFGIVTSRGHNLLGRHRGCAGFTGPGDLVDVDPLLGPLHDNGGPTLTRALLSGSPAIDAADDAVCAAPPVDGVDQRGYPRQYDPHCDIGAFEVQPG
jgi:hypothetical protein